MKRNIILQLLHWLKYLFYNKPHVCSDCKWNILDKKVAYCKAPIFSKHDIIRGCVYNVPCYKLRLKNVAVDRNTHPTDLISPYCKGFDPK